MARKEATDAYIPCTLEELEQILRGDSGCVLMPNSAMDGILDGVFLGDGGAARNKDFLKGIGITHVLNCAQGPDECFCIETDQAFYDDVGIKFCGLRVQDQETADLKSNFDGAVKFIDEALAQEDGRVLIHCVAGFSRSPTVAIAYLMIRRGMTARDATGLVRGKRNVFPNEGFLEQLCQLDKELFGKQSFQLV